MFENIEIDFLYKSPEAWNDLASWLDDPFFRERYENCRRAYRLLQETRGESLTDVPHFLDRPSPPHYRPIFNRVIKNIAERAAVLWHIDHRPEDLEYLCEALRHFIAEGTFGCAGRESNKLGLHADLHTGDAGYICGFCLDTFRDTLPADIRNGLINRLRTDALPAYLAGIEEGDWWRYANFNWGAALHGGSGVGALALWDEDRALAVEVLSHAIDGLAYLRDGLPDGGFCTEGQMYQTTLMGHLAEFLMPWHRISGQDLGFLDNPFVALSGDFHVHMQGGDGLALNVSNMNADTTERGAPAFYWWARQYNRPEWAAYEDQVARPWSDTHGCFFDVSAFWFAEPGQERRKPRLKPLLHFPGLDWANFHKGELWGAIRCGYNAHNHNHRSLGSFILGYGPDRFIVMPGYGGGEPEEHNTLTAGTQVQAARAPILRTRDWADGFWLVADLQPAYVNRCQYLYRHFLLVENRHLLLIDIVCGKNGKRPGLHWYLQSRRPIEATDGGARFPGEETDLTLRHLSPIDEDRIESWDFKGEEIHRLHWRNAADQVAGVHAQLLSVDPPEIAWCGELPELTLSLNGRSYRIHAFDQTLRIR